MCMFVYMWVGIGHTHNDEEHRSANVSHVNRVDDEGYGLARFHVSHVVPRMTPPIRWANYVFSQKHRLLVEYRPYGCVHRLS